MARYDGAAEVPLGVARGRDFVDDIVVEGVDWSADTFAAAIRAFPDQAGAALASFTIGAPTFTGGNTIISFSLTDTQTAALPAAPETGDNVILFWDFERTSGGLKSTLFYGPFTVHGKAA